MAWYISEPNVTGFPEMFTYANAITNDLFGIGILVMVFVIAFAHGSKDDAKDGFASASFITMLFSFFFGILNLVSGEIIIAFIVMTAISAFILRRGD